MKLFKLLELHSKFKPEGFLQDNLGDGCLIETNRIYRAIRKASLQQGLVFSSEFNSDYLALGLTQLENILSAKKIPYFDNISILKKVEKNIPETTMWDEVIDNLKKNNVFHESCHAVARVEALKTLKVDANQDYKVLRLLLEESFANTCELLGIIDVQDSAQKIFYEISSYIYVYEARTHLLSAVKELGLQSVMKIFILSYLHSNFLYDNLSEKEFFRISRYALDGKALEIKSSKNLKALVRISFELNPRFRTLTTGFFMRLQGVKGHPESLTDFDFMSLLEKDPSYKKFLNELVSNFNF